MQYALVPYLGVGTPDSPYRPVGLDQPGASAIDLRPDASVRAGMALIALPSVPASGFHLGDDPRAAMPATVRRRLGNALGVTVEADRLDRIAAELLIDHARTDGTRWRPLRPERHAWRIHLGGLLWEQPVVAGGAVYVELFGGTGAGMGADLTWTESEGGLKRVGDDLRVETVGTAGRGRAEHDTDSSNTRTFLEIVTWASTTNTRDAMVFGRMTSSSLTDGYGVRRIEFSGSGGTLLQFQKVVSGSFSNLASQQVVTSVLNPNERIQVECEGSTIRGYLGRTTGGEVHSNPTLYFTVTDTSIATGTRGGVRMRTTNSETILECDNFDHRDFVGTPPWQIGVVGWP